MFCWCFHFQYGYRLPDNDDDRIYYQINFRPLGPRIFTYPYSNNKLQIHTF